MGDVTTLNPQTRAARRALERYGELKSGADRFSVEADLPGFITDLIVDLYHLANEERLQLHVLMEDARKQATTEGA